MCVCVPGLVTAAAAAKPDPEPDPLRSMLSIIVRQTRPGARVRGGGTAPSSEVAPGWPPSHWDRTAPEVSRRLPLHEDVGQLTNKAFPNPMAVAPS